MKPPKGIDPEVWAKFEAGQEDRHRRLIERVVRMEEELEERRKAEAAPPPPRRRWFRFRSAG